MLSVRTYFNDNFRRKELYFEIRHLSHFGHKIFIMNFMSICRLTAEKSSPVTGLEWPRVFQEVKVPRFHDNGTGLW